MSNCIVIAGVQWGDEGKGKITDILSSRADFVARYQGGSNAGHTVVVAGKKMILHQVPSGILSQSATCVIGPGVVVDPETLFTEIARLAAAGVDAGPGRLAISRGAQAVLPYHKSLDWLRERARGESKIGTTGRGIGPAYEDLHARIGVRMSDLCAPDRLARRLDGVLSERNPLIRHLGGDTFSSTDLLRSCLEWGKRAEPYLRDTGAVLADGLARGRRVLFESAQGTLLDVIHGTYPFVTSSLTTAPAAFPLSGVGAVRDHFVLGVMKAYTTRVGSGPFPTEDSGEVGGALRDRGGEFGSTTGRPRRCGFLDLPALRYAMRVNGVDALAIMKLDVLSGLRSIPVCVGYRLGGQGIDAVHPDQFAEPDLTPVYEEWPCWTEDVGGVTDPAALPASARSYVARIESALGVPAAILSTGSDRAHTAIIRDPWA